MSPRGILQIRSGARAGDKTLLREGEGVVVGRAAPAELVIPGDPELSAVHFEIRFDAGAFVVTDRASRLGTWVEGAALAAPRVVGTGAFVRAGRSSFTLHVEGPTRPRRAPRSEAVDARMRAVSTLTAAPGWFGILDASRDTRILELLARAIDPMKSLYEGRAGDAMADAAPYLVAFSPRSWLLERILVEGWGEAWGVFIRSPRSFQDERRHLRRLLMVHLEGREHPVYFRFYDPRVLARLGPALSRAQRDELLSGARWVLESGPLAGLASLTEEGWVDALRA
ncbi:MAG: DUF4123 domain-containing protein [Polyangiaceae bacterium]